MAEDNDRADLYGGVALGAAALAALLIANSPLAPEYNALLHATAGVHIGSMGLSKSLEHWVNDGLMAIFFLLVGLEIKREAIEGSLAGVQKAALPVIAAIGGFIVPAMFYCAVNWSDAQALRGWAVPAATDIAFAIGICALLGRAVPPSLKMFLLALAIIDDLMAIIVIALFYTDELSAIALLLGAVGVAALVALNLLGVRKPSPYVVVGVFTWVCVLKSGVHATLAGVAVGFAIPLARERERACSNRSNMRSSRGSATPSCRSLLSPMQGSRLSARRCRPWSRRSRSESWRACLSVNSLESSARRWPRLGWESPSSRRAPRSVSFMAWPS